MNKPRKPRLNTLRPRVAELGAAAGHRSGWSDPRRGSRHARGYGSEWDRLRLEILERDAWLCQPCRRASRLTAARTVDHVVPKVEGGSSDPANLQAICAACHQAKTAAESARARGAPGAPPGG